MEKEEEQGPEVSVRSIVLKIQLHLSNFIFCVYEVG